MSKYAHRVKANLNGFGVDQRIIADTPEQWVINCRNQIAGQIRGVMLWSPQAKKIKEQLSVNCKNDWTNAEFFAVLVDYYNVHLRAKDAPKETVPATCAEFIAQLERRGMAKRIAEN